MSARTVLLVGATKGIGLPLAERYLAKGWRVLATTIAPSEGLEALAWRYPARLSIHALDITDEAGVDALRCSLDGEALDALHIVAGILPVPEIAIWDYEDEQILHALKTNAIAGVRLADRFEPLVREGGVFAFTSSGMGSMARNVIGGADLYRISKAALNMLVRSFAVTRAGTGRVVLLICPGWVKTDMGGVDATVEIADSIAGIYRLIADARPDGEGASFREYSGATVPW